ncbi:MAG: DUF2799 domain-containing protein [Desulfobacterales bacterium]
MNCGLHKYGFLFCLWIALAGGCASLSEDQCRHANWYDIGFRDGLKGYRADYVFQHGEACAKYGISVNRPEYSRGYEEGLKQYCIPSNGYMMGLQGQPYNGVCKGPDADAFFRMWLKGKQVYEIEKRLREINVEMEEIDNSLVETQTDREERRSLLSRRRELEQERTRLLIEKEMKSRQGDG